MFSNASTITIGGKTVKELKIGNTILWPQKKDITSLELSASGYALEVLLTPDDITGSVIIYWGESEDNLNNTFTVTLNTHTDGYAHATKANALTKSYRYFQAEYQGDNKYKPYISTIFQLKRSGGAI